MNGFDGIGFSIDPVIALRYFSHDSRTGELFPVSFQGLSGGYTQGVQTAKCYQFDSLWGYNNKHSMLNCSCGFYAYHDLENASLYAESGPLSTSYGEKTRNLAALVKMYGEVVVGSKGIRAQKMELLAFITPGGEEEILENPEFPQMDLSTKIARGALGSFALLAFIMGFFLGPSMLFPFVLLGSLVMFTKSPAYSRSLKSYYGDRAKYQASKYSYKVNLYGLKADISTVPIEAIKRRYPEIPVYSTLKEAVLDFPLTGKPEYSHKPNGREII